MHFQDKYRLHVTMFTVAHIPQARIPEANAEKVQVAQLDGMPSIELHRERYTYDQHATTH